MATTSELTFSGVETKQAVFDQVEQYLGELNLNFSSVDSARPWGGFFVIDESQTQSFINHYFPDYDQSQISQFGSQLSPKILLVEPGKRLSWQYHDRRAELWRTVYGPVGFCKSTSDDQGEVHNLEDGQIVQFAASERHRLIGLTNWGVVAEIWQHTDASNPSVESDIVRLQDDFGR